MKLKSIVLKNFRGSSEKVEVIFDTNKSLSLIFGENGTGKSTIVDGFDFLCNGNFGSLSNYSIGTKAKSYLPTIGKKPTDSFVEICDEKNTWKATISGGTSPKNNIPDARILRRQTILKLIEQEPRERFKELKSFISVPNTEKTESVFRESIKETEKLFNEYSRSISQANDAIEVMWEQAGKNGSAAIEWAKLQVKINTLSLKTENDTIIEIQKLVENVEQARRELDKATLAEKDANLKEVNAKQDQVSVDQTEKNKDSELLKLLQSAQNYIGAHSELGGCPVCKTALDLKILVQQLDLRISEMDDVKNVTIITEQAKAKVEEKKTIRINAETQFIDNLKNLILFCKEISAETFRLFELSQEFVDIVFDSEKFTSSIFDLYDGWFTNYEKTFKKAVEAKKEKNQKDILLKSTIQTHLNAVLEKSSLARTKEDTLAKLKNILQIIEAERKAYIENILAEISNDVADLYKTLHPDEEIGKARFYLKANAIGSLEFDASFQGKEEIPPQAYYSESHLDTLGICVFIALSKYYKTDKTVLILDDVLTSVDAEHMDRFMQLLHDQSKMFNQIIITTHYRPWRDRYKWLKGPSSNVDVIELGSWTIKNGIQAKQFLNAIQELKSVDTQQNFDRQLSASKAGIVLESLLDFLTIQYRCLLPRNPQNEYTLGDLVNGLDGKLAKLLKVKNVENEIELKPLLDKAVSSQWIRNSVGCHFNSLGSEVADSDVKDFLKSVIEVANTMICDSCESLPKKNKSGSFLECNCSNLQLYPLTRPA